MKYSVVDLFAGAGGLSLGFTQTGVFEIKVAFEKNAFAKETYIKNHPSVEMQDDVCNADYPDIINRFGSIDVVIGGPPCQGFSNANRQKNHMVNKNNMLIKQYIRAITELRPKVFVMENVSMLKSKVHRFYLEKGDEELVKDYMIPVTSDFIDLLPCKYRFEDDMKIIRNPKLIASYLWDKKNYATINIVYKQRFNKKNLRNSLMKHKNELLKFAEGFSKANINSFIDKRINIMVQSIQDYFQSQITPEVLLEQFEQAIFIQRMLQKAKEIIDNNILVDGYSEKDDIRALIRSYSVLDYIKNVLGSKNYSYAIDYGVLCSANYGVPQKRMRFVIMGAHKEVSNNIKLPIGKYKPAQYTTVRDAISDIADIEPIYDVSGDNGIKLEIPRKPISKLAKLLRNEKYLYNHIITRNRDVALERFAVLKQGENFHNLEKSMKENTYTNASRTQNTIYLRLPYDEPSGTVVNVRKSMWIHPEFNRAISVREAARLQSFPDSFVFVGTKDSQYQQVGNAVPPILGKAIALSVKNSLE